MSESSERLDSAPRLVVIGGSAGSVRFLLALAPAFTKGCTIPIVVVIHRMRNEESKLDQILNFRLSLPVVEASEKESIEAGTMFVAPPNYHLLLEDDFTFTLADMELVKHSRPSIDVTFSSAADVYREGVVGILLSGANTDGSDGLAAIVDRGGKAIAQDPATAEVETMPLGAIERVPECQVMGQGEILRYLQLLQPK